jgi:hypothetical protein
MILIDILLMCFSGDCIVEILWTGVYMNGVILYQSAKCVNIFILLYTLAAMKIEQRQGDPISVESPEFRENLIREYIRLRRIQYAKTRPESLPYDRYPGILTIEPTPALSKLFDPTGWITVDKIKYIPDAVVKALFVRKDGKPINEDRDS